MKLLIATHNEAKLNEIKLGLEPLTQNAIQLLSLDDMHIVDQPEETGATFKQNAQQKARFYANLSQLPTLADDGGICIKSLNNEPGVKSRRWLGYEAEDQELIDYTLKKLHDVPTSQREAYLEMCLCFYNPIFDTFLFEEEKINGSISENPSTKAIPGYPFRSLFIVDRFGKFYDELTHEEHEEVNHRLRALKRILPRIENNLLQ
ncbi:MAG: non-canonical purine NTP pyrophosphatase [bacterium]|nr:non-canonical purine NTP pyrophosphatase [bacterium]